MSEYVTLPPQDGLGPHSINPREISRRVLQNYAEKIEKEAKLKRQKVRNKKIGKVR